jgi:hypothetical protein
MVAYAKLERLYESAHCDHPVVLNVSKGNKFTQSDIPLEAKKLGHLRELKLCEKQRPDDLAEVCLAPNFRRNLCKKDTRKKYYLRNEDCKSVVHWGQRKLLLNELEFLVRFDTEITAECKKKKCRATILYVGAANGMHSNWMVKAFPQYDFVFFDKAKFDIQPATNVTIRKEYFTDDLVTEFAKCPVLIFWCDMRLPNMTHQEHKDDPVIYNDMMLQMGWHKRMKPLLTMLKFRLSWQPGVTKYLAGEIVLQPFVGNSSTESRLITTADAPMAEYDNSRYEEQMFYHNMVRRRKWYNFGETPELFKMYCHCYDCATEYHIFRDYLRMTGVKSPSDTEVMKLGTTISNVLNTNGGKRTIFTMKHLKKEEKTADGGRDLKIKSIKSKARPKAGGNTKVVKCNAKTKVVKTKAKAKAKVKTKVKTKAKTKVKT